MSTPAPGATLEARWRDAVLAAALVAIDPAGLGGAVVRARHGPVRDAWLTGFAALLPAPPRRLPPAIPDERLLGGLDLGATLAQGRPVAAKGVLAEADGGVLLLPMAERMEPALAGRLAMALDTGAVPVEREGVSARLPARVGLVALDERAEEEHGPPGSLTDRLAFLLDLTPLPRSAVAAPTLTPADVATARAHLPDIALEPAATEALCAAALAFGIDSLRAPLLALRAARAIRALYGGALSDVEAAEIAARLVLAPRATRLPAPEEDREEDREEAPEEPSETPPETADQGGAMADRVLEAVETALPADLLARLATGLRGAGATEGRAGAEKRTPDRGRPLAARPGRPGGRARLDLVATLRAAAPWQALRRGGAARIQVRADDFRLRRFKRRTGTATIFAVDASGSAAMARMAEAKGAVELLLSRAYVRRDWVALVAFRGPGAEVLLPPTRAPALARKRLAGLPGGGATPLAAGLESALRLALQVRERDMAPTLVVLTDGRANLARDGSQGRAGAREDAAAVARATRAAGVPGLVVDIGARPRGEARALAEAMAARYLALPRAEAATLTRAVRDLQET